MTTTPAPVRVYDGDDVTVWSGDARTVMESLPAASVDALVVDPPYGLSAPPDINEVLTHWENGDDYQHTGKGFMGRGWDSFVPGPATWREALRVVKPGAPAVVFAGSRTLDLMMAAMRMAGWQIEGTRHWRYGCLTPDAEVLTQDGWKLGIDVAEGDLVAAWDHADGSIRLSPVQETFRAPFSGQMRVLRNRDTDQVLTPNHRVYLRKRARQMTNGVRRQWWRDGYEVVEAGLVPTHGAIRLPLAGHHDGQGVGGVDYAALLGWVFAEGSFDGSGVGVRLYQNPVRNTEKAEEIEALLVRLGANAKVYDRSRTFLHTDGSEGVTHERTWFFTGHLAERVRADLPGKDLDFPLLWRMSSKEKEAFLRAAVAGDGVTKGEALALYQKTGPVIDALQALGVTAGYRTLRRDRMKRMAHGPQGNPVEGMESRLSYNVRTETELQGRHLRGSWVAYEGDVWCIRVETGAFVARRSGKVFITGNSGMPKSADISKLIDKESGAERTEIVGVKPGHEDFVNRTDAHAAGGRSDGWDRPWRSDPDAVARTHYDFAPVTAHAKQWNGWKSALKGSHEPMVIARAPGGDGRPIQLGDPYSAKAPAEERVVAFLPTCACHGDPHELGADPNIARFTATRCATCREPYVEYRHNTVKPASVMKELVRVCPPGGIVLDPFCGSGSTGVAAVEEGRGVILVDASPVHAVMAAERLGDLQPSLFDLGIAA